MGKYGFFRKIGFGREYLSGVWEGLTTCNRTKKVPYRRENLTNYLAIQWELIYGLALYICEFSRRQIRKKLEKPEI